MSADNGVYVARFPLSAEICSPVWRVAHAQNIEDTEDCDLPREVTDAFRVAKFGESQMHTSEASALAEANKLYQDLDVCEYGICWLEFDRPLPAWTPEHVSAVLEEFFRR